MELNDFEISPFGIGFKSGVYMVCIRTEYKDFSRGRERILYIGSSNSMGNRVYRAGHPYMVAYDRFHLLATVYMRAMETDNYREVEKQAIKKFRPILNKQHNGG